MAVTRAGLATSIGAVVSAASGRVFGLSELYVIAAVAGSLVALAAVSVRLRTLRLGAGRTITPRRVHAGNPCTVEIRLRNQGGRRAPVLRLRDPVSGTRGADLLTPPLDRDEARSFSYRVPTGRRGIVTVGPLEIEIADPFGLARVRTVAAGAADITVLPHVDDVAPLSRTIGPDPDSSSDTGALGRLGEDFAALRAYVVGDDMRRVHWPSSARTGDLLVKQHDIPWQGRVCVVLDLRPSHADRHGQAFERAVSATASVLRSHATRGDHIRLVTTGGLDTGYGTGATRLADDLEHLAVAAPTQTGDLEHALAAADRGASGAVVVISAGLRRGDLELVDIRLASFTRRRVVHFDGPASVWTPRGVEVIGVGPSQSFPDRWHERRVGSTTARARRLTRSKP